MRVKYIAEGHAVCQRLDKLFSDDYMNSFVKRVHMPKRICESSIKIELKGRVWGEINFNGGKNNLR